MEGKEGRGDLLLGEGLVEEPDNDREVAALVVGGEEDGILVLDGHCGGSERGERGGRRGVRLRTTVGGIVVVVGVEGLVYCPRVW
jgi:hypothetical protein